MPNFRITITIVREFDNRHNALIASDALTLKIPLAWELQQEKCEKV